MKKLFFFLTAFSLLCVFSIYAQDQQTVDKQTQETTDAPLDFTSSNLPIFVINTHGQEIPSEPKIEADLGVIYNGEGERNNITDPFNHYNGKIGIELRGSSTLWVEKKQYGVETWDSTGENIDVSLLGMPEESDWVFSAPYADKSLMRDPLTYHFASLMDRWAPRTKHFELILNGEYKGVYILIEKIKRDANRVDIKKIEPVDTTGNKLTGGYILKVDKLDGSDNGGWYSTFPPYPGAWQSIYYQYDSPKITAIVPQQEAYIQNWIFEFETLMNNPGYADTLTGYSTKMDVDAAVDFFLIQEMTKNVDGYRLSSFMYKNRDSENPKLFMGPVWDFNYALGNADYYEGWGQMGWQLDYLSNDATFLASDGFQVPFWWKRLAADPNFMQKAAERWISLRSNHFSNTKIVAYVDSVSTWLAESSVRNFERWQILGTYVWPNYFIGNTYEEELLYLKQWAVNRCNWIDAAMDELTKTADEQPEQPIEFSIEQNYPNPFNPSTTIRYALPEQSHVSLSVYNTLGECVVTIVNEVKNAGEYSVLFDGTNLASGMYIYTLRSNNTILSKKMTLLK